MQEDNIAPARGSQIKSQFYSKSDQILQLLVPPDWVVYGQASVVEGTVVPD